MSDKHAQICTSCKFGDIAIKDKVCLSCKQVKEVKEFGIDRRKADNVGLYCYECRQEQDKHKYRNASEQTLQKAYRYTKLKRQDFRKIRVGDKIKGFTVIFKNTNYMVLYDKNRPYKRITYTINDFITNTK